MSRGLAGTIVTALGKEHGRKPDSLPHLLQALLNCAHSADLREPLKAVGVVDAVQPFSSAEDMRVRDAARGCLLELGALKDDTMQAA